MVGRGAVITHAQELQDNKDHTLVGFYAADNNFTGTGSMLTGDTAAPITTVVNKSFFSTEYGYGLINVAKALGVAGSTNSNASVDVGNSAAINAINAFNIGNSFTGKGIVVAVLDTGVDTAITSLTGRVIQGYDFGDGDNDSSPGNLIHGNAIAGIIAAQSNGQNVVGIAPNATILNVKITNDAGVSSSQNIASAIRYAVDSGAKVISLAQASNRINVESLLVDAANYAIAHDVLIVAAAGNSAQTHIAGPAVSFIGLSAIIVGNLDLAHHTLFSNSNWAGDAAANYVVAPSTGWTTSAGDSYQYLVNGGTSYAAPYAAGLGALLFEEHPTWTVQQVVHQIISTSSVNAITSPSYTNNVIVDASLVHNILNTVSGSNNIITGNGKDTVKYNDSITSHIITGTDKGFIVNNIDGTIDTLANVQRLAFTDGNIALDLNGNGGKAVKILGAVFGNLNASTKQLIGAELNLLDNGTSYSDAMALTLQFAGLKTNDAIVTTLWKNVVGTDPTADEKDQFVHMLDNGMKPGDLGVMAADTALNAEHIDLIGLQDTGIAYI